MDQVFFWILLLLSLSTSFCKYVCINKEKTRDESLSYCRQNYTDLAPVSNKQDNDKLMELYPSVHDGVWFGLERNISDKDKWLWSGGGAVTWTFWNTGQPNNRNNENSGCINKNGRWHDVYPGTTRPFFCYRAIVVKQEKTWEEALGYCRKHHEDLASVASETEMLLIQKELSKHNTTEVVWIGLRFLSEDWLWVDRQMMDYEAWSQGEKPLCPSTKMKCGALQVTRGTKGVWEAHNCEEKLHFICY
ncbi:L-selectin-like [Oreochromis niloticus]|uniref:L-selectin-like n=1 Tax=Oreochromis niloticus TaxID=8128 RepID=UPI0003946011|nr:L-selectin-like [Oreochromis niloticus]CAI5638574.1 unnamed protein product [Mustela putorius furo]